MKNRLFIPISLFLLAIIVFVWSRGYFEDAKRPLEIARAQGYAFPFFIGSLWLASRSFLKLPHGVFFLIAIVGYASIGYSYTIRPTGEKTIVLAPLKEDSFATQTRVTLGELEEASHLVGAPPAVISYEAVTTKEEAEKLLSSNSRILGVIWGNTRWLTLTFGKDAKTRLIASIASPWMKNPGKLEVISKMPSIGLSYDPIRDTSFFLASLFADTENSLRAASEQRAFWTTNVHRSYAGLLYGNLLLEHAMAAPTYQYAMFDCAVDAYMYGWEHITTSDDPDLKNALLNNLAVAHFIQGEQEKNDTARHRAQEWLRIASRTPKALQQKGASYYAGEVAIKNYTEIRSRLIQKNRIRGANHD